MAGRPVGAATDADPDRRLLVCVYDFDGFGPQPGHTIDDTHRVRRGRGGCLSDACRAPCPGGSRAMSEAAPTASCGWGRDRGGALAPPVAVAMMALIGWRHTFAVFGVVGLVWCAVCTFWYATSLPITPRSTCEQLRLIQWARRRLRRPGERVPWKTLLLNPTMIALFCSYFASGFGFQFFVTWLPTYFMREHGLTLQRSGVFASLPLAAGALGCLMGGVIADWSRAAREA